MVIRLVLPTAPRGALLSALFAIVPALGAQPAAAKQAVVPLHVERGPRGDPHLGIDVGLATRTVRLELSTATPGMRIIASAVPPGAVEPTGAPAGGTLVSGLVVRGEQARAHLTFPGAHGSVPSLINVVNGLACSETAPDCPAAHGRTPEMFGGLFPGILGIGNVGPPAERCCANPFDSFGWYRQRYIVHSALDAPSIVLDPDDASLRGFTWVPVTGVETPIGCVRLAGGATNEICGPIVFETAVLPLVVTTTGALTATPLPPGTTATLSVGAWSRTYAIGPHTGLNLVMRSGVENGIVVGLQALQSVDLFYDVTNERIALRSLTPGVAPATKRVSPVPALVGRWRCTSNQWPYERGVFSFGADGTYRETRYFKGHTTASPPGQYVRLGEGEIALQDNGPIWQRERVTLSGDTLELGNGGYWHESHWTAYPSAESFRCTRDRGR